MHGFEVRGGERLSVCEWCSELAATITGRKRSGREMRGYGWEDNVRYTAQTAQYGPWGMSTGSQTPKPHRQPGAILMDDPVKGTGRSGSELRSLPPRTFFSSKLTNKLGPSNEELSI